MSEVLVREMELVVVLSSDMVLTDTMALCNLKTCFMLFHIEKGYSKAVS